jgi:hypothetical protein
MTSLTPAAIARSAISLPTSVAADLSAPVLSLPLRLWSSDEAAASVAPFRSSMTWA